MSLWDSYVGMVRDVYDARAGRAPSGMLGKQQLQAQNMLTQAYGGQDNVAGAMRSTTNFDAQDNPIFANEMPAYQDQYKNKSGLLGSPNDPQAINKYRQAAARTGMKNDVINATIADAQRVGSFANEKEQYDAYSKLRTDHEKFVAKPRAVLETYQAATNLIKDRGGVGASQMTPQDDLALISAFSQMQRPGEAMNEGDVQNIMKTAGLWDAVKASFSSGGAVALAPSVRRKIYKTMTSMAKTQEKKYKDVRNQTENMFNLGRFQGGLKAPMRSLLNADAIDIPPTPQEITDELDRRAKLRKNNKSGMEL